jgi:hypothetical protein
VNNTNTGSVNCQQVNILLSTDGGQTFPTVLASATANDGSEVITVPSTNGTTNRIKVESVGNIFFDISNTNFTIGAAASCGDPAGLTSSAITQTSATVSWNAVSGATSYEVGYKVNSSSNWTTITPNPTTTSANLSNLTAGTLYDWRVRANCTSSSNYVQAQFTTTATGGTCPGAFDVTTNGTTGGAASIALNTDVFGLINVKGDNDYYKFVITTGGTITVTLSNLPADYQLSLLNSGGTTIASSGNSGTANETINSTVAAGTYFARVFPRNNGAFNTTSCYTLKVQTGTASRMAEQPQIVSTKLSVSPNPATSTANLAFVSEQAGNATISVLNQTGSVAIQKLVTVNAGENNRKLDITSLPNGLYYIKIQTGSVVQTAKLVIGK